MTSHAEPAANFEAIRKLFQQLPDARPQLVVLPEACLCFGAGDKRQRELAELTGDGPMQTHLAELARDFGVYLVAGTIPLIDDMEQAKFSAASLVFDPHGTCIARYNKVHLFDVDVDDNTKNYRESAWTEAGDEVVTVPTEFGVLGLAVCYDVRFPELFRALREQGADLIVLPSAFTQVTGAAHWHILTRARAIEQQCALVAAAQAGTHANGRQTYGHALIVDAWGAIVAECEDDQPSLATASIELHKQQRIRANIPVSKHYSSRKQVYK